MSVASGRVAEKDVEALDGVTDLLRRDGLSGAYGCDGLRTLTTDGRGGVVVAAVSGKTIPSRSESPGGEAGMGVEG